MNALANPATIDTALTHKANLFNYDLPALEDFFAELKQPRYRATQLLKWIHQQGVLDFSCMTNFSKSLREQLQAVAAFHLPEVVHEQRSTDGTIKWLIRLHDQQCIETVFIPEDDRGTLCISSQVGCALNCSFCSTATQGFSRDLTIAEIISQLWLAIRRLSSDGTNRQHHVTNVVMMGMGEPLLNYANVTAAMSLMLNDTAYNLSKYRVTLSTAGVVPQMYRLSQDSPVALAVSLHAPNDALRDQLVPINRKYPLATLMSACRAFFANEPKRQITFEYVMLAGINDTTLHAKQLTQLLQGCKAKVNLIPFNSHAGTIYQCSSPESIARFRKILLDAGINTITRKTRGNDIDAACGQLVGNVAARARPRRQSEVLIRWHDSKQTSGETSK